MIFRIATRYFVSKNKDKVISLISRFSVIGIMLGVAAIIVVMGIMRGFRTELIKNIIGLNSHIVISDYMNKTLLDYSSKNIILNENALLKFVNQIEMIPGVKNAMIVSTNEALVYNADIKTGGVIKGISKENLERKFGNNLRCDYKENNEFIGVAVGHSIEKAIPINSDLSVVSASTNQSMLGKIPKHKNFKVQCVFKSGVHEFDSKIFFIPIEISDYLFGNKRSIEVYVEEPEKVEHIRDQIKALISRSSFPLEHTFITSNSDSLDLNPGAIVTDWKTSNESLIKALEIEKISMFSILFLLVMLSGFNIISSLSILVRDKLKDIGILRTIGMPDWKINCIFFINGLLIAVIGILSGVFLGVVIGANLENIRIWLESLSGANLFDPVVYFLYHLPCEISTSDVVVTMSLSFLLCAITSLYPAMRSTKIKIIDIIRSN